MRASIVFSLLLAVGLIARTNAAPLASASCSTRTPNGISVTPRPNAITQALANLASNGATYTLLLAAGTYTEQVVISRDNVVLRGCGTVKVQFAKGVSTSGNNHNAATSVLTVSASNFAAYDISFDNINPQARDTAALALTVDINAKNVGFYRCTFFGFQDTVLIQKGAMAYFSNCYIEGSVDFLWGYGTGYFKSSTIASNSPGFITAHNRASPNDDGAFVFESCTIKPVTPSVISGNSSIAYASTSSAYSLRKSYLGRPWSQYARVIYMHCDIWKHIAPARWSVWSPGNPQTSNVIFWEYRNSGQGDTDTIASFAKVISNSATINPYTLSKLFGDISWIDTA